MRNVVVLIIALFGLELQAQSVVDSCFSSYDLQPKRISEYDDKDNYANIKGMNYLFLEWNGNGYIKGIKKEWSPMQHLKLSADCKGAHALHCGMSDSKKEYFAFRLVPTENKKDSIYFTFTYGATSGVYFNPKIYYTNGRPTYKRNKMRYVGQLPKVYDKAKEWIGKHDEDYVGWETHTIKLPNPGKTKWMVFVLNEMEEGAILSPCSKGCVIRNNLDIINKPKQQVSQTVDVLPKESSIVLKNVVFEKDKATLLVSSFAELDILLRHLKKHTEDNVVISGYTDNRGEETHNLTLSEARAKAVADYLISGGIVSTRIEYKGYGSVNPIATNETEKGRQQNRRVEYKISNKR